MTFRNPPTPFRGSWACETFVLAFATGGGPKLSPFMGLPSGISLPNFRRGCSNGKPQKRSKTSENANLCCCWGTEILIEKSHMLRGHSVRIVDITCAFDRYF